MWRNLLLPSSWWRGKTSKEMREQICWTEGYQQPNWRQWPWKEWGQNRLWYYLADRGERCPHKFDNFFIRLQTVTSTQIAAVFVFNDTALSNLIWTIWMNEWYLLLFNWIVAQIPSLEVVYCKETHKFNYGMACRWEECTFNTTIQL